jgi:hypothetical protein
MDGRKNALQCHRRGPDTNRTLRLRSPRFDPRSVRAFQMTTSGQCSSRSSRATDLLKELVTPDTTSAYFFARFKYVFLPFFPWKNSPAPACCPLARPPLSHPPKHFAMNKACAFYAERGGAQWGSYFTPMHISDRGRTID